MPYSRFATRANGVDKNNASDVNVLNVGLANATVGVFNVLESSAVGDGVTDDSSHLSAADSANGGDGVTHFPATTGGYAIGTSVTLSHATRLPPGAKFKPASGKTLTLNGNLDAGPYQIFDRSAGGSVALASSIVAKAEWWGYTGTDDSAAIHAACNCGAMSVSLGPRTFALQSIMDSSLGDYLRNLFVGLPSSTPLVIEGVAGQTVIKIADHVIDQATDATSNAHMFGNNDTSVGVAQITFRNIIFDGNGANNLNPSGKTRNAMAVRVENGRDLLFENCLFRDIPGHNAVVANNSNGKNLKFVGCTVRNGGHAFSGGVLNANNPDWSAIYSRWDDTDFGSSNTIDNEYPDLTLQGQAGGIEIHGNNSSVTNPVIIGCDPAVYLTSETTALVNQSVLGLRAYKCRRGVCIATAGASLTGVRIRDVSVQLYQPPINGGSVYAVAVHVYGGMSQNSGVFNAAGNVSDPVYDVDIANITVDGSLLPSGVTQATGLRLHGIHKLNVRNIRGHDLPQPLVFLDSSPWGNVDWDIQDVEGVDIGIGAASAGQASALLVNFTGNATTPNLPCFWKNIRLRDIRAGNTHTETFDASGNVTNNVSTGATRQVVQLVTLASTNKVERFQIEDLTGFNLIHDMQGTTTPARPDLVHPQVRFSPRVVPVAGWPLLAGHYFGTELIKTVDGSSYQSVLAGEIAPPTGVTATISLGTPTIATVSDATGIRVGMQWTVAGAGASGANLITVVAAINGTAITMDTAASTAVAGATVTFTKAIFSLGVLTNAVATVGAAHTIKATEARFFANATAGAFTLTLPAASGFQAGQGVEVIKTDSSANAVTIAAAGSDHINGATTKVLSTQYASARLISDGSATWYVPS